MILEFLIDIFVGIGNTIVNFIPVFDFGSSMGGVTALVTVFAGISSFMPMGAFTFAMSVFLAVNGIKLTMAIVNWIVQKIPTIE